MNIKKYVLVLICLPLFFYFLLTHTNDSSKIEHKPTVKHLTIAGKTLSVELATDEASQARGLSGRAGLDEDTGMLFVFQNEDMYSFWMKDMNFPIDMIWLDKDLHVVYIKKNALPASYPETFAPNKNSLYVLEVVSGFSEKNNLKEGDQALLLP